MRFLSRLLSVLLLFSLAAPSDAQDISSKGSDGTLEVATWNVEWFGHGSNGPSDDQQQMENVAAVIDQSNIDLWALQEVSSQPMFESLLDRLGDDFGGFLARQPSYSGALHTAFVFHKATVTSRRVEHVLTRYGDAFAGRPPLHLEATVTLPDTSLVVHFMTVHMKCCDDGIDQRAEAAQRLKQEIDFLRSDEAIVVLGDFNDEIRNSVQGAAESPYRIFLNDADNYLFPSLSVEDAGRGTWCGNSTSCGTGRTYDHILITDELFGPYVEDSGDRYYELLSMDNRRYVYTTSDHLPVYALFDFTTDTAIDGERPQSLMVQRPFPNPFREAATLRYTLDRPTAVQVDLYDALGRHVRSLEDALAPAGTHALRLPASDLPAGLYLVRFQTGEEQRTFPLVLMR